MYRSIEVKNYRCFEELSMSRLGRINLIAGRNNVGKSALLEAIFLHSGAYNPALAFSINNFRGISVVEIQHGRWLTLPWDSLFRNYSLAGTIEITGEDVIRGRRIIQLRSVRSPSQEISLEAGRTQEGGNGKGVMSSADTSASLELTYEEQGRKGTHHLVIDAKNNQLRVQPPAPAPPFPCWYVGGILQINHAQDAERFSKLEVRKKHEAVQRVLSLIEPRLKKLSVAVVAGQPMMHGDIGLDRSVPLGVMGQGMVRLASLVVQVGNSSDGVILIDEVENGLHHAILPDFWRVLGEICKEFNTQVFATTHSFQCIRSAHEAFAGMEEDVFCFQRLERGDKGIICLPYDRKSLGAALESGLEVR